MNARWSLEEIVDGVCDLAAKQFACTREQLRPSTSFVEDIGADSLDLVEFFFAIEERFGVTLPEDSPDPIFKTIFTRQPFTIADMAELVYIQQGTGAPERAGWMKRIVQESPRSSLPFVQLDGRWQPDASNLTSLFEPLGNESPYPQYRRRSDGMRCVRIPRASVEIGGDQPDAFEDELPRHVVVIDAFLIDAEPVSTTAYCRFLNSLANIPAGALEDWFILPAHDKRNEHQLIKLTDAGWRPIPGSERWPMILVSWPGANAYSLWANGRDWRAYRDDAGSAEGSFLPSEAQWEYAARGARSQRFPWGDSPPLPGDMLYGQHIRSDKYRAETLPMADVNEPMGRSPFGLNHMAGNVWQWCRDWYDPAFYRRSEAGDANPLNRMPTGVRSERGGSWIGPATLCRSSHRRGRPLAARGRCLGFRCVSSPKDVR